MHRSKTCTSKDKKTILIKSLPLDCEILPHPYRTIQPNAFVILHL
jgi:hypothetical protein